MAVATVPTIVHVSILVATRDRPVELRRLLSSLATMRFRRIDRPSIDIVVVDNGNVAAGYDADEFRALAQLPVRVLHEPTTGIPFARNTALRARHVDADAVVFVDDDNTVTPSWLEHLLEAAERHGADFVAGPALPRLPPMDDPALAAACAAVRPERPDDGAELKLASTCNLLIRTSWLERQSTWLDESFGTAGGSDSEWTDRSRREGATLRFADRAQIWHHFSADRVNRPWLWKRAYRVGQGSTERARREGYGRVLLARRTAADGVRALVAVVRTSVQRDRVAREFALMRWWWLVGAAASLAGAPRYQEYRTVTRERGPDPALAATGP